MQKARFHNENGLIFLMKRLLREDEVLEEQDPDEIDPAEDESEQSKDQTKDVLAIGLLKNRADTNDKLDDPVDSRDEKENELD